ncbi:hypothetical protein PG988_004435 [Apiospora saccharicola]
MANQRLAHDDIDIDSHFLDITPLHDGGEGAVVEHPSIISIEGLGQNPFGTFRSPLSNEIWLRDYLPHNTRRCRILLYGYDSKVPRSRSDQSIQEIASTCKNRVANFRQLTKASSTHFCGGDPNTDCSLIDSKEAQYMNWAIIGRPNGPRGIIHT